MLSLHKDGELHVFILVTIFIDPCFIIVANIQGSIPKHIANLPYTHIDQIFMHFKFDMPDFQAQTNFDTWSENFVV